MIADARHYPLVNERQTDARVYTRPPLIPTNKLPVQKRKPFRDFNLTLTATLTKDDLIAAIKEYVQPRFGTLEIKEAEVDFSDIEAVKVTVKS
ncbi:hypothetical protein CON15_19190 [Bacillus cereus]|uniref:Uncharacterized protein n=1 Tax=Bacillus thuringiensis TaxID=1428 RepID=A0A9X6YIX6_BACTU|nr:MULTISPECIES: hypothetical protein [Bacillus cereus group]MDO6628739.1 hypothetical protein [Bacillus thuringiensis]MDO6659339.1 hypothetical protein [Bacillus thuringiensis]MDO6698922.1 hypothetical protein [Bacillus thuringiensis]PDZ55666.1 hypothetical protein CON15_19190 [Bacillus cereus]PED16333.1 hypothetical protein CON01_00355 [Bacillus thuringiensis]